LGEIGQLFDFNRIILNHLIPFANMNGQIIPNSALLSSVFGLLQELKWIGEESRGNRERSRRSGRFLRVLLRMDAIAAWRLGEIQT
jgi:hypothetical protein